MSSSFVIDPDRRLVSVRMWGEITRAEIQALAQDIARDSRLGVAFSELIDLRDLTSAEAITAEDLRALATMALDPVARRAFVVPTLSVFGLARMFQSHRAISRSQEQIAVVRTIEEAEAWLTAV